MSQRRTEHPRLGLPPGVRELSSLRPGELASLGDEASDLARISELGAPLAPAYVIALGPDVEAPLSATIEAALGLDVARPVVEIGALFTTHALAARASRAWPELVVLRRGDDVRGRVRALLRALESPTLRVALGGSRLDAHVRVVVREDGPHGTASSVEPSTGDPDRVGVWEPGAQPHVLDRKTMRVEIPGTGELSTDTIERAADLVPRAQLALARPVEIRFGMMRGSMVVLSARRDERAACFGDAPYRRVALLTADEGPIAPLAVDCLDQALRQVEPEGRVPRVERIYARAYRAVATTAPPEPAPGSLARAAISAAQVASDVGRPLAAARQLRDTVDARIRGFAREPLDRLPSSSLVGVLRERQALVIEVMVLLERSRIATFAVVAAMEAAVGKLPRECVHALAALRRTRERRRADERLLRFARHLVDQVGEVPAVGRVPAGVRRAWDDVAKELSAVRPLGVDVRPRTYGSCDEALRAGIEEAQRHDPEAAERARREATRRLLETARSRPLGRAREALVAPLTLMLSRLADSKGELGEALASAALQLREAACAIGARLVRDGVIDEPEDALLLDATELAEALSGEPGAYAARVRLRREADARWRAFDPPRRIDQRLA